MCKPNTEFQIYMCCKKILITRKQKTKERETSDIFEHLFVTKPDRTKQDMAKLILISCHMQTESHTSVIQNS